MKNLLLFLLICLCSNIFSQQQVIFKESKPETYMVKYDPNIKDQIKDNILNIIAKNLPKSISKTQFTFSFNQKLQLTKSKNKLNFIGEIENIVITGDITYKGFDISDALFPQKVSYTIKLFDSNSRLVNTFKINDQIIGKNPRTHVDYKTTDTTSNTNYRYELVNKVFKFDVSNKEHLQRNIKLINAYYNTEVQIKMSERELATINVANLDRIHEYQAIVDKTNLFISHLNDKKFETRLNLSVNDPIDLTGKIRSLINQCDNSSNAIKTTLDNLHKVYYNDGLDYLKRGNVSLARGSFKKAIDLNMEFGPAYIQLAHIDYTMKDYHKSIQTIRDVINGMNPAPPTMAMALELAGKIFDIYLTDAKILNDGSNFEEALGLLNEASHICQTVNGLHCSNGLDIEYHRAYEGQYFRQIAGIDVAIRNGDFNTAERQIVATQIFQTNFESFIEHNNALMDERHKLYNAYVSFASKLNKEGEHENALEYLEKANHICVRFEYIPCDKSLKFEIASAHEGIYSNLIKEARLKMRQNDIVAAEKALIEARQYQQSQNLKPHPDYDMLYTTVQEKKYHKLIDEGKAYLESNNYQLGLERFHKAKEIELANSFTKDAYLDGFIKNTAALIILNEIEKGEKMVLSNSLIKARSFYNRSCDLRDTYGLDRDIQVIEAIERLRNKILTQECLNAQKRFDGKYDDALRLIDQKKYPEADDNLQDALRVAKKHPDCLINTADVKSRLKEITPIVTYIKKRLSVIQLVKRSQYSDALDQYHKLTNYFTDNNISSFGIKHKSTKSFIIDGTDYFILFGVKHYAERKEYENSLDLLKELKRRLFQAKLSKFEMIYLGGELATKDFGKNSLGVPKQTILNYTNGDKWYKYLKKGYLKQWKRLLKAGV